MAALTPARAAVEILRKGGLVAIPTETVYGLAADAENELAVRRIFAVKGRPSSHPLIVHLGSAQEAKRWAREFPAAAHKLAEAFWPGPLTLVVKRSQKAADAVTGGQDSVALRVPAHPLAREILEAFGGGLAAPSANRFGKLSPTTAEHVQHDLGAEIDLIVDGGPCAIGVESTIVDVTRGLPVLLRPGGVSTEALGQVLGTPPRWERESTLRVPGQLATHYAPRAGLVLCEAAELVSRARELATKGKKVAVLSMHPLEATSDFHAVRMPEGAEAFARILYATLREIDERGYDLIVVSLPEKKGLGLAIIDRLSRAAVR